MKKILLLFSLFFVFFTSSAFASIGVGVGVGKIQVDQKLNPGQIYTLPPITVLNTGTEASDYRVLIEHQENQQQLIPEEDWFLFSPPTFHLDPKKAQTVKITLSLPVNAKPGYYFAYLEAQPIRTTKSGITAINIAAATKLYFSVVPSSLIAGIYYKLVSIWVVFSPIPQIIAGIVFICLFILFARRFVNVEIKLSKNHIPMWAIVTSVVIFFILYSLVWMKIFQILRMK